MAKRTRTHPHTLTPRPPTYRNTQTARTDKPTGRHAQPHRVSGGASTGAPLATPIYYGGASFVRPSSPPLRICVRRLPHHAFLLAPPQKMRVGARPLLAPPRGGRKTTKAQRPTPTPMPNAKRQTPNEPPNTTPPPNPNAGRYHAWASPPAEPATPHAAQRITPNPPPEHPEHEPTPRTGRPRTHTRTTGGPSPLTA